MTALKTTPKTTELSKTDPMGLVEDVTTLVGVIDLKNGAAVHAIQGKRDQYQPVGFCSGDPVSLLGHYVRLGIRRFYVADLDAITGVQINTDAVEKLAEYCGAICDCIEIVFDLGWRGRTHTKSLALIQRLNKQIRHCQWIAATEAMPNPTAISELVEVVEAERTILSLDYQRGQLLGEYFDEHEWLFAATGHGVRRFLALDLASVGSDRGPMTVQTCERIASILDSQIDSEPQIYSGGGIRSRSDADALRAAGCTHFLLATALYPQGKQEHRIS